MYSPMVGVAVVVAFAPEERTSATRTCAVALASIRACVTHTLAVVVEVVAAVLVRDASVRSPSDGRVRAVNN